MRPASPADLSGSVILKKDGSNLGFTRSQPPNESTGTTCPGLEAIPEYLPFALYKNQIQIRKPPVQRVRTPPASPPQTSPMAPKVPPSGHPASTDPPPFRNFLDLQKRVSCWLPVIQKTGFRFGPFKMKQQEFPKKEALACRIYLILLNTTAGPRGFSNEKLAFTSRLAC